MSSSDDFKAKGNDEFRNKNFEAAIGYFTQGIEVDANNHVLYSNRSACHASLGQWDKALTDAQKCVELNPTWSKGYTRLGAAFHGMGKLDEAHDAYKKLDELDPSDANKERLQEVEAAMRARVSNPFGKIFGPDTIGKIQSNPKLAPFLMDPQYVQKINMLIQNPSLVQGFMQDQKIQATIIELLGIGNQMGQQQPERSKPATPPPKKAPEPEKPKDAATLAKERGNTH
eukprot:PhM_4_TR2009/c1_g2_i1/m.3003/K09553/STIP1; stress-induced-phosphoprotein 1